METVKTDNGNRPTPPGDLDGEALDEWGRVCDELDRLGRLDTADRAILTLYVRTWAVWQNAAKAVVKGGPTTQFPNGYVGLSHEYKAMSDTAKQLEKLLKALGLTPTAREPKQKEEDGPPIKLEY